MLDPALGFVFGGTPFVPRTAVEISADLILPVTVEDGICHAEVAAATEATWLEYGEAWRLLARPH